MTVSLTEYVPLRLVNGQRSVFLASITKPSTRILAHDGALEAGVQTPTVERTLVNVEVNPLKISLAH